MCGGFKMSRQWIASKDEARAKKYQRLAELKSGREYTWPCKSGDIVAIFGGHARSENLGTTWSNKVEKHIKIMADNFAERNTIDGSRKFKHFKVPDGKAIHGILTKNLHEIRIVTQPATGNVAKVHHRMPGFVDVDE